MRTKLIHEMYRLEATYWWHVAKRRIAFSFLRPFLRKRRDRPVFLDAGCGTGMMLRELSEFGRVYGIDGSSEALSYCQKRGLPGVILADLAEPLPVGNESIDVVTMLDVLEHIHGDVSVISEIHRVLRKGGLFVLTVPAYPWLWTYWDEILGHKRRYRRSVLVLKLQQCGFSVVRNSYFYSYLLPLAILFRITKTILGKRAVTRSDFISIPTWVNRILLFLSSVEISIAKLVRIPIGLSVICVCRKD